MLCSLFSKHLLQAGIMVPVGHVVRSSEEASAFAKELGK